MKLSKKSTQKLKKYLDAIYPASDQQRMTRCKYFNDIMRSLHGDICYDEDPADKRRAEAAKQGLITALPDQLARFGEAAVREMANDLVSIIMPVDTPYAAVGEPKDKEKISTLMAVCRTFATNNAHRSNAIDTVYNCLTLQHFFVVGKYEDVDERPQETDFAGVVYDSIDPYACFWDPGTKLRKNYLKGALMGWHEEVSPTEVYMDAQRIVDYDLPGKDEKGKTQDRVVIECPTQYQRSYRKDYTTEEAPSFNGTGQAGVDVYDMVAAFGDMQTANTKMTRTTMYMRIPAEVLSENDGELTTYKMTFLQGILVHIEPTSPGSHGFPIIAGNLFLDHDHRSYRSYGEHAADLTNLVSAYINLVKRGMRREAIGGTTFVDGRLTKGGKPLNESVTEGSQFVEVSVPASANGEKGLSSYIMTVGGEGSGSRIGELGAMTELFTGRMFPRSAKQDLVGMDRATAMHASMAASAADSTLLALAIMLDDSIGVPWRRLLKNLIINNARTIKLVDPKQQQFLVMDAAQLRSMEFDFTTSQPVAGFDRNRVLQALQFALNTLVQMPQVQENPQLVEELLDYFMHVATAGTTTMQDLNISLFEKQRAAQEEQAIPPTDPTSPTGDDENV